jgi:hypothetical protein
VFLIKKCVQFHRENLFKMCTLTLAEKYSLQFIQGVSAKTFEPNNSVIFQRIFVKFKMQIF